MHSTAPTTFTQRQPIAVHHYRRDCTTDSFPMVLTSCWRCARVAVTIRAILLQQSALRPIVTSPTILPQITAQQPSCLFSTTPAFQKSILVKKKPTGLQLSAKQKGSTTLRIKKKAFVRPVKHAVAGERRAQRKNLVLANVNATPVELPQLTARIAVDEECNGSMFVFDGQMIDTLRNLEGFQLKQGWRFFYKPSTLVRKESIELGRLIAWVNGEEIPTKLERKEVLRAVVDEETGEINNVVDTEEVMEDVKDLILGGYTLDISPPTVPVRGPWAKLANESRSGRRLIHGFRGIGKSILLLQSMAWAHQRQWVVITIPNAQDLTVGHTEYEHDPVTSLWVQKQYTSTLLHRIANANSAVLGKVRVSKRYVFSREYIPKDTTLLKMTELGALEPVIAWDIFTTLLTELGLPGRPPVLFTLDNFGQITINTNYRDAEHKLIHGYDFALPSLFVDYLSGKRSFWRGVTLGATSSNCPATPALNYALQRTTPSPYLKLDPRIAQSLENVELMKVSPLTKEQAKSLMQYYNDSGLYGLDVESTLAEKRVVSSGVPNELLRACARVRY